MEMLFLSKITKCLLSSLRRANWRSPDWNQTACECWHLLVIRHLFLNYFSILVTFFLPLSVVAFHYQKKFYKLTSIKFRSAWHNTFFWQFFFKTDFSFSVSFMSFHSPCSFATCLKKTGCCSVYTDFFGTGRSSTRLAWGWYGLPYIF